MFAQSDDLICFYFLTIASLKISRYSVNDKKVVVWPKKKELPTQMFRVRVFSFFIIKTPRTQNYCAHVIPHFNR